MTDTMPNTISDTMPNTMTDILPNTPPTTLKFDEWSIFAHDNCAVTIADIKKMKHGESLKVLIMCRNVWDTSLVSDVRGKSLDPQTFFKNNWGIYVHDKDLCGKFLLFSFETNSDNPDLDNVDLNSICRPGFEFEIEYKPNCWYPLENGSLPGSDPQKFAKFPWPNAKHWTEFDDSTRVGYRGHMVRWSDLTTMPNIIWPFPKETINAFDNESDRVAKRSFCIVLDENISNLTFTNIDLACDADTSKWACYRFANTVRKKINKHNIDLPISFGLNVIETTHKSKLLVYKYTVRLEPDGPVIDGIQCLGNNIVKKVL